MADIQRIQCKNHQKKSSYRRNSVPYKEIGIKESYTVLPDNSILITGNMQSETGFPSSHQLKSYVASKSRLKLAARAVLSADAGLLVIISMALDVTEGIFTGSIAHSASLPVFNLLRGRF